MVPSNAAKTLEMAFEKDKKVVTRDCLEKIRERERAPAYLDHRTNRQ